MKIRTLRQRLIITTVAIVTVTSTLFAGGVLLIKQKLEEGTFGNMVHNKLMILIDDPEQVQLLDSPLFQQWHYYRGKQVEQLPPHIRDKAPGAYHSIPLEDRYYHMHIVTTDTGNAYLFYDITEWENQEHSVLAVLAIGVLVVLGIALLIATGSANKILEPVQRLTRRLSNIDPKQRQLRIASEFDDSDIGQIAEAFDTYLARIDNFVERERSFTAAASHELRTPLSVMMGAVDVIEANSPNAMTQRAVDRIRRACADMRAFIEAALLLSREEDSSLVHSNASNLCELLQQVQEDLQPQIHGAQVQIETDCRETVRLPVPESISKILLGNLLRNAIEHTGGGNIFLTLCHSGLTIRDTGSGIPAEDLPKVFDRRFSTKAEGTGLGLYMVKRICDKYGWTIAINAEPDKGTTVTVKF